MLGMQVGNHSQQSEPIKCHLDTSYDPRPTDPAHMARQHSRTAAPLVGHPLVSSVLLLSQPAHDNFEPVCLLPH